jgi:hypothetical protein
MIGKLITKFNKPKTYTNGTYDVRGYMYGFWRYRRLWGIIIRTKYSMIYDLGAEVNFPKYHNFWDKEPQFKLKEL